MQNHRGDAEDAEKKQVGHKWGTDSQIRVVTHELESSLSVCICVNLWPQLSLHFLRVLRVSAVNNLYVL